jgi:hypothetical protein
LCWGIFVNIDAIDADDGQLAIRIAASPQETHWREQFQDGLFCAILALEKCAAVRSVLSLVNLRWSHNHSTIHWWTEPYCSFRETKPSYDP